MTAFEVVQDSRFIVSPDGTLFTAIDQDAPSDDSGRHQQQSQVQLAALPDATGATIVAPLVPGTRIEVDLDTTPLIRLAVSLSGAHVEVSGGKIIVTLADGGVIVLEGSIIQEFLAGSDVGI